RMHAYRRSMRECADRAIDSWPAHETFELYSEMERLVLDIALTAIVGVAHGAQKARLVRAFSDLVAAGERPMLTFVAARGGWRGRAALERLVGLPRWATFERIVDRVDAELRLEIARRRAAPGDARDDVLALLLAARDEQGRALEDDE